MKELTLINDIKTFANAIKSLLEIHFGEDYKILIHNIKKNNDINLTGISISKKDTELAPTIYLESFFEEYKAGKYLETVCAEVISFYNEKNNPNMTFDKSIITDFNKAKDIICLKLVNAERNKELLKHMPHVMIEDLAVVFYILVFTEKDGFGSIRITNEITNVWNINTDKLYKIALENTQKMNRGYISNILDVMPQIQMHSEVILNDCDYSSAYFNISLEKRMPVLYVATNSKNINGANVILYDGLLKKFAKLLGEDFYILPSSIHEVMIIPLSFYGESEEDYMKQMVYDTNRTAVEKEDFLSNNIYRYYSNTDSIKIV